MNKHWLKLIANILIIYIFYIIFPEKIIIYNNIFGFLGLIGIVVILNIVNIVIRPILSVLTVPINIVTFGLFAVVINTWMLMLADKLTWFITIRGFLYALLISIVMGFVNGMIKDKNKVND